MTGRSDFDWTDDESIVIPEQAAIAVFRNPAGNIVIRQRDIWDQGKDDWIVFAPEKALVLIKAILRETGLDGDVASPESVTKIRAKDRTAAERQRRYRARKRNGCDARASNGQDRNVTDCDGVTRNTLPLHVERDG